jgi:hypothetical protein
MNDPLTTAFDVGFDFATGTGLVNASAALTALAPKSPVKTPVRALVAPTPVKSPVRAPVAPSPVKVPVRAPVAPTPVKT